jgi:hypothetical protein
MFNLPSPSASEHTEGGNIARGLAISSSSSQCEDGTRYVAYRTDGAKRRAYIQPCFDPAGCLGADALRNQTAGSSASDLSHG